MQDWLVNGQPDRVVDVADRGLAYGDGLFETIAVRGGVPRFFDRHMTRLLEGCRRLAIPAPPVQRLGDEILQLAAGRRRGTAKVIITRGSGVRGYRPPAAAVPTRVVGFTDESIRARARGTGIRTVICRTPASSNAALAGLKTLNRLDNVMARSEWQDESVDEGLMRDTEGNLIGGTMSNLFLVRDGRLLTPMLDRAGIRGIMRGVVLEAVRAEGIDAVEARIGLQDLAEVGELFVTNALIGLWPVACCGDRRYEIGRVTAAVAEALAARGVEECGP